MKRLCTLIVFCSVCSMLASPVYADRTHSGNKNAIFIKEVNDNWTVKDQTIAWTKAERSQAVTIYGDWLIDKEEASCGLKQSYKDPNHMELRVNKERVYVLTPFFNGINDNAHFWFDTGTKYILKLKGRNFENILLKQHLPSMKTATKMYIEVQPKNSPKQIQVFSLVGFTKAYNFMCENKKCSVSPVQTDSNNLEVNFDIKNDKFIVHGKTVLPNGMDLTLSIYHFEGKYATVEKTTIKDGKYTLLVNKSIPKGKYVFVITSPHLTLQSNTVQQALGIKGTNIPIEIRKESYGQYGVYYRVIKSN